MEISRKEAEERIFKKHGNKIILLEYKNAGSQAKFKCGICGYTWYTSAESVWYGKGCRKCSVKRISESQKLTIGYVEQYVKSFDCKLLSDAYKNSHTKLEIEFKCGHIGMINFSDFKQGKRCRVCGYEYVHALLRLDDEKIKAILLSKNFKFIEFPDGYKNRNSLITYECDKGHIETRSLSNIINSKYCKTCSHILSGLLQKGVFGNNWKGGLSKIRGYLRKRINGWKEDSVKQSNGLCVIENIPYYTVHHLYGFNLILENAFKNLNLVIKESLSDYSQEELDGITEKVCEMHNNLLGVCLTKRSHDFFHKTYGQGNNTPEQFEEFKQRIASGDLKLPD